MKFKGQYYDEDGNTQEAVVEADDRASARAAIREMGGIVSLAEVGDHVNVTGDEPTAVDEPAVEDNPTTLGTAEPVADEADDEGVV